MISSKLFRDLSANTIQTGITQLAGLIIFYFMSKYLPKSDFGEYGWSTAVGSTVIAIGSLGLDLVLVKRIAAGRDALLMAGIHFFHTLAIGILTIIGLWSIHLFYPAFQAAHPLLLFIVLQLIVSNIANTFKFSLTGLERFKYLAIIACCFNLSKLAAICMLFFGKELSIINIVYGFLAASVLELLIAYYYLQRTLKSRILPRLKRVVYKGFIIESLPQLGVVLFDSALARIDWILLGIFSTVSITAEYSFAYKFFELSKIPLLILAPVLLTRLTKLIQQRQEVSEEKQKSIQRFFDLEVFLSCFIPLIMVSCWSPLIDWVTDNKYGSSNETTFRILAICVPLHFIINFYWTVAFVNGRLKQIMYITIGVSLLNILLNILAIPKMGSLGAAYAFLFSTLIQMILYVRANQTSTLNPQIKKGFLVLLLAIASACFSLYTVSNPYVNIILTPALYLTSLLLFRRQFSLRELFRRD